MRKEPVTLLGQLMQERDLGRDEVVDLLERHAAHVGEQQFAVSTRTLDRWLASGVKTLPRPVVCRVLKAVFGASAEELLGSAAAPARAGRRPDDWQGLAERLRREADGVLTAGTVSASRLGLFEEAVEHLRRTHIVSAPEAMLGMLMPELGAVLEATQQGQTALVRRGLSACAAQLAILTADCLMKLGATHPAVGWFRTARTAADDAGLPWLAAQARAQAAMLPYYYGDLRRTVALAVDAQQVGQGHISPAVCLAAAAEARAEARLGHREAAHEAIARAVTWFEQLPDADDSDAFAFPAQRLALYLSGAWTYLGDQAQAAAAQSEVRRLHAESGVFTLDPTLIRFDEASGLATHDPSSAIEHTRATIEQVPGGHFTKIVTTRGTDILNALPAQARTTPAAQELAELLATPAATPIALGA
ncbi:hypothetical protein AB0M43_37175 [Longispora sp. NPDC051575]|uniref:hypothetical protein n=1 Tax=Longispora sp. NPDC051575 TaxID=3154943 RepID=UPI00343F9C21